MAVALLSCQGLTRTHHARPLFQGVSFGVEEGDRIGLIGPNGSGKSTLMKILAGEEKPDAGTVAPRKGLRAIYLPQEEELDGTLTVEASLASVLDVDALDVEERALRVEMALQQGGFPDRTQNVAHLSGGWRKRLALVRSFLAEPELLLLDEPTNHLDLDGVLWLEDILRSASYAVVVITHDRYFLENVATRILELNPAYAGGCFSTAGTYSNFLEQREAYLERQQHQQQALASVVRREVAWLRRGAQARSTKAKGRIEQAGELIKDLAELKYRNSQADRAVEGMAFSASGRMTKEMVTLTGVSKTLGGRQLFHDATFTVSPRRRIGLVGPNGSGKTTILRLITGDLEPDTGKVRHADGLKVLWFEQNRDALDLKQTVRDALSPNSDTVRYRDSSMHVSGYAQRFLFRSEQLTQPVATLSGGEQARLLIAKLMLETADVLILDEPTNDLDIPSLEVLEEGLTSFPGAVVLVTHDRYLLEQVSTEILGILEDGSVRLFADYEQYATTRQALREPPKPAPAKTATPAATPARVSLSTAERRELSQMEEKIMAAEEKVAEWEAALADPAVTSDPQKLQEAWTSAESSREAVTALYARWEELEAKQKG